jgi:hypothetical protein
MIGVALRKCDYLAIAETLVFLALRPAPPSILTPAAIWYGLCYGWDLSREAFAN